MPSPEVTITVKELQILFNIFDFFEITYPLVDDFHLLDVSVDDNDYRIKVHTPDFKVFDTEFPGYADEFPAFHEFKECFLSSGCIKYDNVNDFERLYKNFKDRNKRIYFSPDTNILYHEFLSSSFLKQEKIPIAATVNAEIIDAMNFKYDTRMIDAIYRLAKINQDLVRPMYNRRVKKSRKAAYFAMREKKRLVPIEVAEVNGQPVNYAQKDLFIIKELQKFMSDSNVDVVLLTADRAVLDLCSITNLECFVFNVPARIETRNCSASSIQELIFGLATLFGFIKLDPVIIFGEFSNKNNLDELRLQFKNDKMHAQFMKDLRICRRLMDLKKTMPTKEMDF
nr:hypothetical protein [Candidatus Sigynarchaeota archaeon]